MLGPPLCHSKKLSQGLYHPLMSQDEQMQCVQVRVSSKLGEKQVGGKLFYYLVSSGPTDEEVGRTPCFEFSTWHKHGATAGYCVGGAGQTKTHTCTSALRGQHPPTEVLYIREVGPMDSMTSPHNFRVVPRCGRCQEVRPKTFQMWHVIVVPYPTPARSLRPTWVVA